MTLRSVLKLRRLHCGLRLRRGAASSKFFSSSAFPSHSFPFIPFDGDTEEWIFGAYSSTGFVRPKDPGSPIASSLDAVDNALGRHLAMSSMHALGSAAERKRFSQSCTPAGHGPALYADLLAGSMGAVRGHRFAMGGVLGVKEIERDERHGESFLVYCKENGVSEWAVQHSRALEFARKNEWENAAACWERALLECKGDIIALMCLSEVHIRTGQYEHAWSSSARVSPWWEANCTGCTLAHFYGILASGLAADGRCSEAESFAARALELCPDDTRAANILAATYLQEGRYREVSRLAREMREFGYQDEHGQLNMR